MEIDLKNTAVMTNNNEQSNDTISNATLLGEIVWLFSFSKLHREWSIKSIHQWILPALMHGHFRIYRRSGKPRGYISWARLSKKVEEAYVLRPSSLQPADWKSGERGWIIDFVVPFGDTFEIAHDLKYNLMKDQVGRILHVKPGSDVMHIKYIHGANAIKSAQDRSLNPTVDIGEQ